MGVELITEWGAESVVELGVELKGGDFIFHGWGSKNTPPKRGGGRIVEVVSVGHQSKGRTPTHPRGGCIRVFLGGGRAPYRIGGTEQPHS